jgi:predicted hotdog family 3-hydroxylacyl-ACP dehydratase
MLNRSWIEAHIPHKGSMCLLDTVDSHGDDEIACTALSHHWPHHPLRDACGLGIVTGIEYAAQAMAVHGALRDGAAAGGGGYLVSARDVTWSVERLDACPGPLTVRAQRVSGTASTLQYRFSLHAGGDAILSGRAMVVLDAGSVDASSRPAAPGRPS